MNKESGAAGTAEVINPDQPRPFLASFLEQPGMPRCTAEYHNLLLTDGIPKITQWLAHDSAMGRKVETSRLHACGHPFQRKGPIIYCSSGG